MFSVAVTSERHSVSYSTEQAYFYDWSRFAHWCAKNGLCEMPAHPKNVCLFLQSEQNISCRLPALSRLVASIGYFHRRNAFPSPLYHEEGFLIQKVLQQKAQHQKTHVNTKLTNRLWSEIICAVPDTSIEGIRDKALLSMHVAGAFRALELSRMNFGQIRFERNVMQVNLGKFTSKTARGASSITISDSNMFSPVSCLRRWIETACIMDGSLFRHCRDDDQLAARSVNEEEINQIIGFHSRARNDV